MYVIAHYHEVALKGGNKAFFIERLLSRIRRALTGEGVRRARESNNVIFLELDDSARWEHVRACLSRVFGLSNFSLVEPVSPDLDAVKDAVRRAVEGRVTGTFRITSRRADKRFPLKSEELNRELGAYVQSFTGAPVSLKQPDLTVYVDVLAKEALVYTEKVPGPGGLPVGTGGRVMALLSGGIDSPVAAYRMMRRGCSVAFVHYHSYPFLDASSKQKAQELVEVLDGYQGDSRLYMVPFGEPQRQVVMAAPEPYRTVIYRRLMMRIANRLCETDGASALVTGESLGQVASQTLENMAVVDAASERLVLRPLVGMDKLEIVRQAEQIGTFPISIEPDQDCCQLFMPRRPATHASPRDLQFAERNLDIEQLVSMALAEVEVVRYSRQGKRKEVLDLREAATDRTADRPPPTAGDGDVATRRPGDPAKEGAPDGQAEERLQANSVTSS
jgi:thiamine biosynthesis protein ThiI